MPEGSVETSLESKTSLDRAFMQAEVAKDDAAIQDFYQVFVNEVFYLLLEGEEDCMSHEPDNIRPYFVSLEEEKTALIFDTEERMAQFIDKPSHFVTLTGQALVEMFVHHNVQLGLNLGVAPSSLIIHSDILKTLWQDLMSSTDIVDQSDINDITVSPPMLASEVLVKSLHMHLELWRDTLAEAFLIQATVNHSDLHSMILCVVFKDGECANMEQEKQLVQTLSGAATPYLPAQEVNGFHVCILHPDQRAEASAARFLKAARVYGLNFFDTTGTFLHAPSQCMQ